MRGRSDELRRVFLDSPIVAAVTSDVLLSRALSTDVSVVFILYGTLLSVADEVSRVKAAGKIAIVHVDLIGGMGGKDPVGVDFIHTRTQADGIISTKQNMVRRAHELGMFAGQRTFIVDSMALRNTMTQLSGFQPDFLEVMPGILTNIISELHHGYDVPLVAGGLIRTKREILDALGGGACAISTTKQELWSV